MELTPLTAYIAKKYIPKNYQNYTHKNENEMLVLLFFFR